MLANKYSIQGAHSTRRAFRCGLLEQKMGEKKSVFGFNKLPEDCITLIFSLTSPQDCCRLSTVSKEFQSAAEYDDVWGSFLPPDYEDIIARSCTPIQYSSKKHLFRRLCESVLIDGGTKAFGLGKANGGKSYILSARELYISQVNDPNHWSWITTSQSRFDEVAELKTINNLEIEGTIKSQALSPNTKYGAYIIIKVSDKSFGLDSIPTEMSLKIGDLVMNNTSYLRGEDVNKQQMEVLFYKNRMQMLKGRLNHHQGSVWAIERDDGWMEIEFGEFYTECDDECNDNKELQIRLTEVKGQHLKGGLIIQGEKFSKIPWSTHGICFIDQM